MTVACPDCRSVFRVDPAKVPASGVRARCSVCGGVIAISGGTLPVAVTPTTSTAAVSAAFPGSSRRATAFATAPTAAPSSSATPLKPSTFEVAPVPVMTPPVPMPAPSFTPSVSPAVVSAATAGTPADGRRAINPFLRADPEQRARRLARALVSDLVAYHPQKQEEGLRDGTLRQLFREEIKKSYEEYVEQVGRETAERSPHFQDALNEILGGGRKLF